MLENKTNVFESRLVPPWPVLKPTPGFYKSVYPNSNDNLLG